MLVTLADNQNMIASTSYTFTYSPNSVQGVLVNINDASTGTAYDHTINIQLGSTTVCNTVDGFGILGFNDFFNGGSGSVQHQNDIFYFVDLGSHQLLGNDNLYVTIVCGANELTAVDIAALVDNPLGGEIPLKYTQYTDSTFTSQNVLKAVCWDASVADIGEATGNCEIRNSINAASPSFISSVNWFKALTRSYSGDSEYYGTLVNEPIPYDTTFNYSSDKVDRILVQQAMTRKPSAVSKGKRNAMLAKKAFSA